MHLGAASAGREPRAVRTAYMYVSPAFKEYAKSMHPLTNTQLRVCTDSQPAQRLAWLLRHAAIPLAIASLSVSMM